jgi:hypothetical protein
MSRSKNTGALCIISDSDDTDDEFNLYNCFQDVESDGAGDDFSFIQHKVVEFRGYINKIAQKDHWLWQILMRTLPRVWHWGVHRQIIMMTTVKIWKNTTRK